jgi:hypothetical protein
MDTSAGRNTENIPFYTVWPQLTEGAGETLELQSESVCGQNIATCNHIQIPETRNLLQLDLTQSAEIYRDAEQVPHGISSEHNGQGEEDSVLEVRDALRIGKYNPSAAKRIDVETDSKRTVQTPKFIICNFYKK